MPPKRLSNKAYIYYHGVWHNISVTVDYTVTHLSLFLHVVFEVATVFATNIEYK